jgi:hypothetical protein
MHGKLSLCKISNIPGTPVTFFESFTGKENIAGGTMLKPHAPAHKNLPQSG